VLELLRQRREPGGSIRRIRSSPATGTPRPSRLLVNA
jgi:hypothetical protein